MKEVIRRIAEPATPDRGFAPNLMFWCPGCQEHHGIKANRPGQPGPNWTWDGDMERPTFSPSVLVTGMVPPTDVEAEAWNANGTPWPIRNRVCHSFVRGGRIEFLADCTHALAGKTVDMVPVEEV